MNILGWNRHKKKKWHYPDRESTRRPVLYCSNVLVPVFALLPDLDADDDSTNIVEAMNKGSDSCSSSSSSISDSYFGDFQTENVNFFTQGQLNDFVKKRQQNFLASRHSEHRILDSEAKMTFYRNTDEERMVLFQRRRRLCVLQQHPRSSFSNPYKWRLFINSSERSLECVLLYNGGKFPCVLIGHSVILKGNYTSVKTGLHKLSFDDYSV